MLRCHLEPFEHTAVPLAILSHIPHELVHRDDAEVVISTQVPWGSIDHTLIQSVLTSYISSNKKTLVFMISDDNEPFDIPQTVLLFRTGMYRRYKHPNEHLLPYVWVHQELGASTDSSPFTPCPKISRKPIIGFCGLLHSCRMNQIALVKSSPRVTSKIILNTQYWGGAPGHPDVIRPYKQNIYDTQFTLCGRGAGNFSARFYHTLSLGRIPIVVDTDMVFPLEDRIPWNDVIVRCEEKNVVSDTVTFWNQHDIIEAQKQCKALYDCYLAPDRWCHILVEEIIRPFLLIPSDTKEQPC